MKTWPILIAPFAEEAASSWVDRVCRTFRAPWEEITGTWYQGLLGDVALDAGTASVDIEAMAEASGVDQSSLRSMFLASQFPGVRGALLLKRGTIEERLGWQSWRPSSSLPLLRVCPACLQEKGVFYYRLSWRFKVIRTCQQHKCWLLFAHQVGDQARFRGDACGFLAHALALDKISLQTLGEGKAIFPDATLPASRWFLKFLPPLITHLEADYYPKHHPGIRYLCAESERLGRLFKS